MYLKPGSWASWQLKGHMEKAQRPCERRSAVILANWQKELAAQCSHSTPQASHHTLKSLLVINVRLHSYHMIHLPKCRWFPSLNMTKIKMNQIKVFQCAFFHLNQKVWCPHYIFLDRTLAHATWGDDVERHPADRRPRVVSDRMIRQSSPCHTCHIQGR